MNQRLVDRILPALLAVVLAGCAWLLVAHSRMVRQREEELAGHALSHAHQLVGMRLSGMFNEWEADLQEEAAAVRLGTPKEQLLPRWRALMASHWSINAIRLADEGGGEHGLYRLDTALWLVETRAGSKDSLPVARRLLNSGLDSTGIPWSRFGRYDPRERVWFSKALENHQDVPVWGERQFGDSAENVLQVALLIRSQNARNAYQVILFDVSLDRAEQLDTRFLPSLGPGMLLFDSEGETLFSSTGAGKDDAANILRNALTQWLASKTSRAFPIAHEQHAYAAQVAPVMLNGLTLHSLVAIDAARLVHWTEPDRRYTMMGAAALAAVVILLGLLWMRSRQRDRAAGLVSLQLKQSEFRLGKAQGERDALSREVHHRVKNNLQVVSSLLNLQASSLTDGPVRNEFLRGKRRIDTIALVHHRLYDHPDLRRIDLRVFLGQLTASIAELYTDRKGTISVGVETNGITCDQDTAIELGIIVCELVNNAFQHAFPHATGGHVEVTVTRVEGDLHRLMVHNNGVAPDHGLLTGPGKLGLEIVEALAEQLDGSLHVRSGPGVAFEVLFRVHSPASAEVTDAEPGK